ncbi:MAG: ribose 5-phosphate isomerase B [Clostridiales bacterium]|nr:ribose 5-phosphate isomerase B [Clostridiales bacterium]
MKIALGADHGGFQLKETIKAWLVEQGYETEDKGTYDEASCDYPDFGEAVARDVAAGKADRGILVCGTGIGISISANKVRGIRAALCGDTFSARMCRLHNDANVLALGQRVTGAGLALDIVEIWLHTDFEGGRHKTRVDKIMKIEEA